MLALEHPGSDPIYMPQPCGILFPPSEIAPLADLSKPPSSSNIWQAGGWTGMPPGLRNSLSFQSEKTVWSPLANPGGQEDAWLVVPAAGPSGLLPPPR